ncbi:MAG: tRNA uridine-5-carboxymethylaminomethyl(34) synthesis GTPase MnmE [Candidatus Omnitrophica bacterium]|nr:tRNA uridine-5-carboxymethylaminomethyl(34) synthesis GTPase MnmE [Candidatus Omnitrophota bacterium]
MSNIYLNDTIVAISTPIGEGGIGIVRLSGRESLELADKIFLSKEGKKPSEFKTYTVHYGHIIEKDTKTPRHQDTKIVDEVILTVMRAPRSYTKENVVEINCHSGIAPLKKIMDLCLVNGARLAEPGEFTKRAFLNGRIDILQAEAVLDIIKAKTELSLRSALNNLEGLFSKKINEIRKKLIEIYVHMEASIDFSEDDLRGIKISRIFKKLNIIKNEIEKLVSNSNQGRILRQGIKTVICGSPNVGKSSLMNAILKESRSIVTHIPGTTRDTIEEIVNIRGIPVTLVDTAGITDTDHLVEKEGIRRSRIYLRNADLILLVLDWSRRLNKDDVDIIKKIRDNSKEAIVVINKVDLKRKLDIKKVKRFFPKSYFAHISALNLKGVDNLEDGIKDIVWKGKAPGAGFIGASNERQLDILRRCASDINEAMAAHKSGLFMDCTSVYVRSSIESLGEITGQTITDETLDKIFSEFCIGK